MKYLCLTIGLGVAAYILFLIGLASTREWETVLTQDVPISLGFLCAIGAMIAGMYWWDYGRKK